MLLNFFANVSSWAQQTGSIRLRPFPKRGCQPACCWCFRTVSAAWCGAQPHHLKVHRWIYTTLESIPIFPLTVLFCVCVGGGCGMNGWGKCNERCLKTCTRKRLDLIWNWHFTIISRVLRPPGGGSNFSLGFDEPTEQPVRRNKMASSIFGTPEENPPSWAKSAGTASLCDQ